jgi:RNA polymerase sigma-70 factor (ECF subfamily)
MMAVMLGAAYRLDQVSPVRLAGAKKWSAAAKCVSQPGKETATEPSESDIVLLEAAGRGNREAFGRLYHRLAGPLYSLALKMLGDPTDAEDALVEGLEAIWKQAPQFDGSRSSAFSWSVMVFRARTIDRVRKRASQARIREQAAMEMGAGDAIGAALPEAPLVTMKREEWAIVRQAVDALEEDRAALLRLAFFDGMTHQEIAEKTGRPLGTVKTTIRRSLLELRAIILGRGYEP